MVHTACPIQAEIGKQERIRALNPNTEFKSKRYNTLPYHEEKQK
jgi:hypothetical protein